MGRAPNPPPSVLTVPIGQWVVAASPTRIRTLLGSCIAVILHDRDGRRGGMAHIVLPDSRGRGDHPGKYADTAIPALIAELNQGLGPRRVLRLSAKIVGGARMFKSNPGSEIGQLNRDAVECILERLDIPILARDLGGEAGRNVTLDTTSGLVLVRVPGGAIYEL